MKLALVAFVIVSLVAADGDAYAESGRIKRKLPDAAEAERITSDMAMNDGLLRRGDIVATDRGFFVFLGVAEDGYTNEFAVVPNPVAPRQEVSPAAPPARPGRRR